MLYFVRSKYFLNILDPFREQIIYIHTYLAQTPEIGQGLGRFLSCGARKQEQKKEDNLPPHWGSNPRTSVCEANALPLTPQQTAFFLINLLIFHIFLKFGNSVTLFLCINLEIKMKFLITEVLVNLVVFLNFFSKF